MGRKGKKAEQDMHGLLVGKEKCKVRMKDRVGRGMLEEGKEGK